MARVRIFETENFRKDLTHLSRSGLSRIESKLREHVYPQLRQEPHFGPNIKRLKNWEPLTWRFRIGSWRFFYEIEEKGNVLYLTTADHRGEAYR